MTEFELLQEILTEMKALRSDVSELKQGQARLEAKVDTNHKEAMAEIKELKTDVADIKSDVQYLKGQDDIDTQSINGCYNGIKELNDKFDKQAKSIKFFDKSLAHFHDRLGDAEEEVKEIKARLDRAS
jgi:chromosome segregation ATPase